MKKKNYNIEHLVEQFYKVGYTDYINEKELRELKGKLKKTEYQIYSLFPESSHVILYKKEIPPIHLVKIENMVCLRHQDIMGTIYSLGLKEGTFGDIIKYKEEFYLFLLPKIKEIIKESLTEIKRNKVNVKEVDLSLAKEFKLEFKRKELIVSSLRIDNVVATLIHSSRSSIIEKFKNKEILLNLEEDCKPTRILQVGDTFSIRKYGKYKYSGILKETKKGGFLIEVLEYK